mgnify:CR=1 FL=1
MKITKINSMWRRPKGRLNAHLVEHVVLYGDLFFLRTVYNTWAKSFGRESIKKALDEHKYIKLYGRTT